MMFYYSGDIYTCMSTYVIDYKMKYYFKIKYFESILCFLKGGGVKTLLKKVILLKICHQALP